MADVLFTNVRIFDGGGEMPFTGDVLVQGNRISRRLNDGRVVTEVELIRDDSLISSSVYGDRTCSDSLPQVSTDTPNAFCNVKPIRDTGLLSPAM